MARRIATKEDVFTAANELVKAGKLPRITGYSSNHRRWQLHNYLQLSEGVGKRKSAGSSN
jgi:hypothetical protein